jgi:hypothetical protein
MKNGQNSKVDMSSFVLLIELAITFVLSAYFGWNFLVAAALSTLVGESFIKSALTRKTADDENVPKLIAIATRGWWVIVGLTLAPVLYILMSAPGRRLSGLDYIFGELIIVAALAKAGWLDWNHSRRSRAAMLFLSCIGWVLLLLSIPGRETITTAILLFVTLGLTAIAFLWSLVESLFVKEKSNDSIQATHQINRK